MQMSLSRRSTEAIRSPADPAFRPVYYGVGRFIRVPKRMGSAHWLCCNFRRPRLTT
jgi:hypothetical protein